jgi:hypothetical protein
MEVTNDANAPQPAIETTQASPSEKDQQLLEATRVMFANLSEYLKGEVRSNIYLFLIIYFCISCYRRL